MSVVGFYTERGKRKPITLRRRRFKLPAQTKITSEEIEELRDAIIQADDNLSFLKWELEREKVFTLSMRDRWARILKENRRIKDLVKKIDERLSEEQRRVASRWT